MFYQLSKWLDVAFSPLCWSLLCMVVASALGARRRRRAALGSALAGIFLLYAFSTGWVAGALSAAASRSSAPQAAPTARFDAVVLLGGFATAPLEQGAFPELSAPVDRLFKALELYRSGRARRILISGGAAQGPAEAELIAELLRRLGVPASDLLLEVRSLNTHENALFSRALIEQHGLRELALVTSASHAQRAYEAFRAVGLELPVVPCDYEGARPSWDVSGLLPRAGHLARSEGALRELCGLWIYRLRGYALPAA